METIHDLKELIEEDYKNRRDWYYGTITIIRKNEKDIVIKFSDINDKINKICKEIKETINWTFKGHSKLGKLIEKTIKPNETVIFKNLNFKSSDTGQPDFLFKRIFEKVYNINLWKLSSTN